MNPRVVFATVLFIAIGVSAVYFFGPQPAQTSPPPKSPEEAKILGLPPDEEGPVPVATAEEIEYEFGVMELNQTGKHVFTITNTGEDVLKIKKGPSTCKCTVSDLPDDVVKEIKPGETTDINLEWTPKQFEEEFGQEATVWTNDPKKHRIDFRVRGRIVERIMIRPSTELNAGFIDESKGASSEFYVCSESVTDFAAPEVTNKDERVAVEVIPMTTAELQEFRSKAGFKVMLKIAPNVAVGDFRESLSVVVPGQEPTFERDVILTARRLGPITYIPKSGTVFYQGSLLVDMGYFQVADGKVAELTMLIDREDPATPIEITGVESDLPLLKVDVKPNAEANEQLPGKSAFTVKIEIPPGSPAIDRARATAPKIFVRTTHPEIPEIVFRAEIHGL